MDRRSILKHTGIAGVLAAGIAPAVHAQATIRWRLTSSFPKALDTIHGAANVFAQKVGEMTGGKFQVTVHAPGELVPAFGVVDAVQAGTVEAGHTAPYYYVGKEPGFAFFTAMPSLRRPATAEYSESACQASATPRTLTFARASRNTIPASSANAPNKTKLRA